MLAELGTPRIYPWGGFNGDARQMLQLLLAGVQPALEAPDRGAQSRVLPALRHIIAQIGVRELDQCCHVVSVPTDPCSGLPVKSRSALSCSYTFTNPHNFHKVHSLARRSPNRLKNRRSLR